MFHLGCSSSPRSASDVIIYPNNLHTLKHRKQSFCETTTILREGGSTVQRVYDEEFSNQDQLNIREAVVTLSGNLFGDILIHVADNMLLQHIFDVRFRWILSGVLLKFNIASYYLENYYFEVLAL